MKRIIILLFALFTCIYITFAQEEKSEKESKNSKAVSKKPVTKDKKVVVKKPVSSNRKAVIKIDTLVDDRNGYKYKLMKFGNAFWMTENLRWKSHSNLMFDNDLEKLKKLGRMYTYDESKIACPSGSHLPSKLEWDSLALAVDPKFNGDAGDKLIKKQGFAAIMGGYKNSKGKDIGIDSETMYWATNTSVSFKGDVEGAVLIINPEFENKEYKCAYYIRCVKDY